MPDRPFNDSGAAAAGPAWQTFAVACGAVFVVSLDATIMIAAFPALRSAFDGTTPSALSWVFNAYTIVYAALLAPAGRLADLYGRKRLFVLGLGLFTAASLVCAVAPTVDALILARAVQAVGAALLTPSSLALILAAFPTGKRAILTGLWGAVGALAAAIGPAGGAALIEATSWRMIFAINLPIGLALMGFAVARLRETRAAGTGAQLDLIGIVLIIAGVGLLTFALIQTETAAASSIRVWGGAAGGMVCLALYIRWAWGKPAAAIDLSLFGQRTYAFVTLATFVFGVAFSILFLGSYLFLISVWGFSPATAGLAITPGPLMVIPVAILAGRWAARSGHRVPLVTGGILLAASQLVIWMVVSREPAYWTLWFPSQLIGGVAVGLVLPALAGAAVAHLSPDRFGVGGAVNNAVRQFGAVIGTALAIVLVGEATTGLDAFRHAFLTLAALSLMTAIVCLPVNTRPVSVGTR